ncbi:MAG: aspartate-semialdehyde dehydrogenase [Myxococcota bacterium]
MKVAVIGATGMVGTEMLKILEERDFPVTELIPLASAKSVGRTVQFRGQAVPVQEATGDAFSGVRLALFSAGSGTSKELAPKAAAHGALVVDNSSAWRMDPDVPLCVPEVNLEAAKAPPKGIIANPNCSTIQMVVALGPLHRAATICRIVVSTYQAISGAGARAVEAFLEQERAVVQGDPFDGPQLARSCLMHWSPDEATGYQEEELKMVHETRKILGAPSMQVSPTAVRIPVITGHAESIAIDTEKPLSAAEAREILEGAPGVEVRDDLGSGVYPTPLDVAGTDPVFVGRIRDDIGNPGGVQLWVVADNLRKGAALNAIQIAEGLLV